MISIESEILLPCSAEQAFEYIFNPDYFPQWMGNFRSRKAISSVQGKVGSTAEHIQKAQGKTIRFTERIEEVERPERFRVALSSKGIDVEASYTIEAKSETECRLVLQEAMQLKSFFFRSVSAFIYPMMKSRQESDLQKLKRLIVEKTAG